MNGTLLLIKNNLLNLNTLTELDFESLQKKIKNKDYITSINAFLSNLFKIFYNDKGINTQTTKIFLSAYMMMTHIKEISNNDVYSIKLGNHATEMILNLENLFNNKKITLKDYNNFMNSFNRYIEFFHVWRERDSLLMARPAINSYFNTEIAIQHLGNIKQKETEEESKMRKERIEDLKKVLSKLRKNIKIIAGQKGLSFLESKEMPYFKDEEIFKGVEKTVRKAFWDVVSSNFKEKNYKQLLNLLDDIKNLIIEINPNNKTISNELNEIIDIELLTQMINQNNNQEIDSSIIYDYIKYIISYIQKFQSPSEDQNTLTFIENIENMFQKNEKTEKILRYFFEISFEKLEKIKFITLKIRKELNL